MKDYSKSFIQEYLSVDGLLKVIKYGYLIITQPTLMKDVDDPSERVDKCD